MVAARRPEIFLSVSATTRMPRPEEVHGREYLFLSEQEFAAVEARGEFLETATVHGTRRYGTPRPPVELALAAGRPVLLEIDVQGARIVKKRMPEAVTVFIDPPSWEVLEGRLRGRGTEDSDAVARRLATAREELATAAEFDRRVVNDDLEDAAAQVDRILVGSINQEGTASP